MKAHIRIQEPGAFSRQSAVIDRLFLNLTPFTIEAGITSEKKLTELFVQGYGERHLSSKRLKFIELAAAGIA